MSAARLRDAATLLRERVDEAINTPWKVDGEGTGLPIVWADYDYDGGSQVADVLNEGDAHYIAMMSPPVALALADWLEQHDDDHSTYECRWEPCAALAVADAILGGDRP